MSAKNPDGTWSEDIQDYMEEIGASVRFLRWIERKLNTGLAATMQGAAPAQRLSAAYHILPELLAGIGHDVVRDMGYDPTPDAFEIHMMLNGFVRVTERTAIDRLAELASESEGS